MLFEDVHPFGHMHSIRAAYPAGVCRERAKPFVNMLASIKNAYYFRKLLYHASSTEKQLRTRALCNSVTPFGNDYRIMDVSGKVSLFLTRGKECSGSVRTWVVIHGRGINICNLLIKIAFR